MSHEMGALLLSEVIHHTLKINNKPLFAIFLDARSAFDRTVREILSRKLYLLGTTGDRLIYLDNRLKHRTTAIVLNKEVVGLIDDRQEVEQGGICSGDLYGVYNNEQFDTVQESSLGVHLHDVHVASVGQADDCVLVTDVIKYLQILLHHTEDYCAKYHVF